MALTPDQQAQVDLQEAMEQGRRKHDLEMEKRRVKLEAVRLAKETLIENARTKPVGNRDISAADITGFADALTAYVTK